MKIEIFNLWTFDVIAERNTVNGILLVKRNIRVNGNISYDTIAI
ncbi:MAG: hypothetical protein ACERIH_11350 [Labilibaculum antarcticum]